VSNNLSTLARSSRRLNIFLHYDLSRVLQSTGSDWEHVLKVEIFLKRMEDFDKINVIYEKVWMSPASVAAQAILTLLRSSGSPISQARTNVHSSWVSS
jgi:hypothetical protein